MRCLKDLGELHFGRKRIQPPGREIRAFYESAEQLLKHELLTFDNRAVQVIADAVERCIKENGYTCYAGVIMPDHGHLCIRKHKHLAEKMIDKFQRFSAGALLEQGLRPANHPVWGTGGWKVYLDEPDEVHRTIRYIEQNPAKMRQPIQRYPWITSYDNWPYHRRLRFSTPRA
jgi:hypothetical protein